jgi:hypothetical protein
VLTRFQVARRIGRSVATVRRLEGKALHPSRDGRGINRFDEDEVERVAQEIADNGHPMLEESETDEGYLPNCDCETLRQEHRQEVDELETRIRNLENDLYRAKADTQASDARLNRLGRGIAQVAHAMMESNPSGYDCDAVDAISALLRTG